MAKLQLQMFPLCKMCMDESPALAGLRQLGGFAASSSTASMGSADGSSSQLVQAMAGFGGGSGTGESLNTAPLSADTSQQPLLTTPQHA